MPLLSPVDAPHHLIDLTSPDVEVLTNVLSLPLVPPDDLSPRPLSLSTRRHAVVNFVRALPGRLRAPLLSLSRLCGGSETHLCSAHDGLCAPMIRSIFAALVAETTLRLSCFTLRFPFMSRRAQDTVSALRAMQAMWLPPNRWAPPRGAKWRRQPDGCEACVLARIGADESSLVHLRAALLSRTWRNRRPPRLLRWVDGWIGWTGRRQEIEDESQTRSRELRKTRRAVLREQGKVKPSRKVPEEKPIEEEEEAVEAEADDEVEQSDGEDSEARIIDYYAALEPEADPLAASFVGVRAGWKTTLTPEQGFIFPPFRPHPSLYTPQAGGSDIACEPGPRERLAPPPAATRPASSVYTNSTRNEGPKPPSSRHKRARPSRLSAVQEGKRSSALDRTPTPGKGSRRIRDPAEPYRALIAEAPVVRERRASARYQSQTTIWADFM
ncbi:MAG: hypothetical protein M1832_004383 [Thelocarpon impressellum]|nr:MAG: hypothetical protein M1832_004383 [Thelocarpon impressellum]